MKVKCDYCDNFYDENEANCPSCGAANSNIKRVSNAVPKTIEELQQWYNARNLPSENVTRFFIGKDYKGAKAFGIYRDGDEVIVYKNKDDGSRAIRYQGKDEAYAVNELYMKLKETVGWQKNNNRSNSGKGRGRRRRTPGEWLSDNGISIITVVVIVVISIIIASKTPTTGYYRYNGDTYYYHDSNWYRYDDYNDWDYVDAPDELSDNYNDYYESGSYSSEYGVTDIENTSWADSWDDDSDWDSSDSWDSDGGTDWGSDW